MERPRTGLLGWLIAKSGGVLDRYSSSVPRDHWPDQRRAHLILDNEKVSGKHARVDISQGQFVITDLESSNGTL